ncbi:MAG: T9SS type A sorting domain-containing protein [Bacteroidota bacterium]
MRYSLFTILMLGLLLSSFGQETGPEALTVGGSVVATPSGGSLSQAVGEVATITLSSSNGSLLLSQGVLQGESPKTDAIAPIPPGVFVKLYPNPAHQQLLIETNATFLHQVKIWDMLGREVRQQEFSASAISLDGLAEGHYSLGLYDEQAQLRYTWRFVKY